MKILIICGVSGRAESLARLIRECAGPTLPDIGIFAHDDVFKAALPKDADAAFLTVESAADVEAARQMRRAYPKIPLVVVGSEPSAAVKAVELDARYYLDRAAGVSEVAGALGRCGLDAPGCDER